MISPILAHRLRNAGVSWRPVSGDAFVISRPELAGEVFVVSDMTIEPHEFDTGTVLGFNGTTEWALDSVPLEDALWLPRENQLRELLGATFVSLRRTASGYSVAIEVQGTAREVASPGAADAYAEALLLLVQASV